MNKLKLTTEDGSATFTTYAAQRRYNTAPDLAACLSAIAALLPIGDPPRAEAAKVLWSATNTSPSLDHEYKESRNVTEFLKTWAPADKTQRLLFMSDLSRLIRKTEIDAIDESIAALERFRNEELDRLAGVASKVAA